MYLNEHRLFSWISIGFPSRKYDSCRNFSWHSTVTWEVIQKKSFYFTLMSWKRKMANFLDPNNPNPRHPELLSSFLTYQTLLCFWPFAWPISSALKIHKHSWPTPTGDLLCSQTTSFLMPLSLPRQAHPFLSPQLLPYPKLQYSIRLE